MRLDANLVAYVGLTLLGLAALAEWADPTPPAGTGCRVGYVYDGDSVEMICGPARRTSRLIGLDSPELKGACASETAAAQAAKKALTAQVKAASAVEIRIEGHDKYGRDLIRLVLDGRDAAETMIAAGHARPYHGGHRAGWCE